MKEKKTLVAFAECTSGSNSSIQTEKQVYLKHKLKVSPVPLPFPCRTGGFIPRLKHQAI
uniref:Uncharacterized protein n=1 Tax=Anguilla anguilla TaxID=7936 RepID=A0A0E9WMR5_ANGAN